MRAATAALPTAPPPGGQNKQRMEGTCMELALEGERLCKAGDCRSGVGFFEAAVQVGTDDLKTLSAIYSQLGNAYFYLQEYGRALEYHKHDLNLARTIGDKLGEAKASGNLGNTLKVLGKFEEAVACCQRHLDISREISDRIGEARALYNLGNVYHAKGKHAGRSANQDPGDFPPQVKECLQKAAKYYEANLEIVQELGDRAAQGRACGNLGNTHYLLGNFGEAIRYHEERLAIAKEFGDKSAERRAHSNLGNAHIFMGEFEVAAEEYKKTLQIAKQLMDRALEAQACYSLGNTYTLLRDYPLAIEYHMQHLRIAQELSDKIGEGRACWSLGNAHAALGDHEKALHYASKHLVISKEIGDETGELTAQMNLTDLRTVLGISDNVNYDSVSDQSGLLDADGPVKRPSRARRVSMENMQQIKMTPDKDAAQGKGARPKPPKVQKAATVGYDMPEKMLDENASQDAAQRANGTRPQDESVSTASKPPGEKEDFFAFLTRVQGRRLDDQRCSIRILSNKNPPAGSVERATPEMLEQDGFFDLLTRSQSRRINDQRCSFQGEEDVGNKENQPGANHAQQEEFLDMVAGIQGSRMNDQRASAPSFPGLNNAQAISPYMNNIRGAGNLDDQFFEMLMRCQGSRMEDQRTTLPTQAAPTVPDEDFFSLIQRVQSNRLDEQRSSMPRNQGGATGGSGSSSSHNGAGGSGSSHGGSGSNRSGGSSSNRSGGGGSSSNRSGASNSSSSSSRPGAGRLHHGKKKDKK